jgi:hypothetical protein
MTITTFGLPASAAEAAWAGRIIAIVQRIARVDGKFMCALR